MSAAILQGVPASTIDTDIWVELPPRQFVKLTAIVLKLGGTVLAPTVAALSDDSLVNFLPRVDGVGAFDVELRKSKRLSWQGMIIPALCLESILKSKMAIQRPKDIAHIPLIRQTLKLSKNRKSVSKPRSKPSSRAADM